MIGIFSSLERIAISVASVGACDNQLHSYGLWKQVQFFSSAGDKDNVLIRLPAMSKRDWTEQGWKKMAESEKDPRKAWMRAKGCA